MWTDLRDRPFTVSDISSPATVVELDSYENAIAEFEAQEWTYIPMPADGRYYNVRTGELRDLEDDQIVPSDLHLLEAMRALVEWPFLLAETGEEFHIVNLADLNRRRVKEFIYPVFSELESQLSRRIVEVYEDPRCFPRWASSRSASG